MIKIVGLGPGSKDALTIGTIEALKNSNHIYLRTKNHPMVPYIESMGIEYSTYDDKYENADNFDEVYNEIANDLILQYKKYNDIVYAVIGNPLAGESSVKLLIDMCNKENIDFKVIPALSLVDALIQSLNIDISDGLKIIDSFNIKGQVFDKRNGLVIMETYDKYILSDVKLALEEYYNSENEVYYVRNAGILGMEEIKKIPLYELDRQEVVDHLTLIYLPSVKDTNKDFFDLVEIMDKLRGENGCPWDKEQTHEKLKRYLIEESYEVIEAIDEEDDDKLVEELGDVLLQVIFHAQIGKEEGYFNINDVINGICKKMIDRHPHVFGELKIDTSSEVLDVWDEIKKSEQKLETHTDELKHVVKCSPALMRAEKVQKKAAKVGFDWDSIEPAMDKVIEELNEIKDVYKGNNRARILEEVGDLIFACVNVSRFLDIDPEFALHYTIDKFIKRFEFIEKSSQNQGLRLEHMSLEQMDVLWEKAKINTNIN